MFSYENNEISLLSFSKKYFNQDLVCVDENKTFNTEFHQNFFDPKSQQSNTVDKEHLNLFLFLDNISDNTPIIILQI